MMIRFLRADRDPENQGIIRQGDHAHRQADIYDHSPACHVYEFPDLRRAFATLNHDSFGLVVLSGGIW